MKRNFSRSLFQRSVQLSAHNVLERLHAALFGYMARHGLILGANTLTALVPTLFSAAQEVSNEPFGVINAINVNFDDKQVAKGDAVDVPIAPTRAATDFTPAATSAAGSDATATTVKVQISKSRKVSWNLTGEQLRSLENGGTATEWVRQLVAQGMRTLRNEAEADCAAAIKQGASRAVGVAGTTPFGSDINLMVDARKVLVDNGAPLADLQMVVDTSAGAALRKLGIIQQAYMAGNDAERRTGQLLRQFGFLIQESAGIALHTPGTGAGYLVDMAGGLPKGATDVTVDTGNGTILAGDVLTFAGTADQYVVNGALAGTAFSLGRPGARFAEANNDAITLAAAYTPNMAFERNAVVGILRPPVMPPNPTQQVQIISDQRGMSYMLVQIAQYGMTTWELHLAWGFKVVQSEHVALVLG